MTFSRPFARAEARPELADVLRLVHQSLVFWTWVRGAAVFALGFLLGRLF